MNEHDVAIIGAGPYGLSVAAHLRTARPSLVIFGEPMAFWRRNMPVGMRLRSPWSASSLSDPERALTLDAFEQARGTPIARPIPLEDFIEYGRWFQTSAAPDVDTRHVRRLSRQDGCFELALDDGERVRARAVVVAAGISAFAKRPTELGALPPQLVSHSSDHDSLDRFEGQTVAVVGAGQSAIESAALLREAGANVEVVARADQVRWLGRSAALHRFAGRLLYAPSDVGPAGVSWIVAAPWLFRRIPRTVQDPLARRCVRPAASGWLAPRVGAVRITTGRTIRSAEAIGPGVQIELSDGTTRAVDHVLLATGFSVDIRRYDFVARDLLGAVDRVDGYPKLDRGFQSSVRGLYFVGAPAAWSFGPLARFVAGAHYAARTVARSLAHELRRER